MALFRVVRRSPLSAAEAWRRVTDWRRHGEHVPLTRVEVEPAGPTRPGTLLRARTGLGPLGFDDPMEVVRWEPPAGGRPGRCRLEKRGAAITGWAEIEVRAVPGGSLLLWEEDARIGPLPRLLDAPTARAGRIVFGRLVRSLLSG
ncbi:SRPBCC family protein [Nocardiopsis sp. CNT-189]|uniref:SRPBCC family protein n=1 Tax=Nocardiopsis oceanisediminis TaxID=2816862 RepID=UPI003B35AD48